MLIISVLVQSFVKLSRTNSMGIHYWHKQDGIRLAFLDIRSPFDMLLTYYFSLRTSSNFPTVFCTPVFHHHQILANLCPRSALVLISGVPHVFCGRRKVVPLFELSKATFSSGVALPFCISIYPRSVISLRFPL